jgi:uncharacterized protein
MRLRQLFPLGKAYGAAFCNRVKETKTLKSNLEAGKHTLLLAPRRYGKSSLCERVFETIDFPWAKIDFHTSVTWKDAERVLIHSITNLISKSVGQGSEKLIMLAKKYAKKIQPKLSMGPEYLKLELSLVENSSPAENIVDALMILEKLLKEKGKYAALLLDEFQEISLMENGKGIEGAIRSAAQEMQHLSLIFCGSIPHLLAGMFEDERRPLYKLCRKITLERISEEHYKNHLNCAAKLIWKGQLQADVFKKIMELTERHPYYVNYICDVLCSECGSLPTCVDVENAWDIVIEEERSDLNKDFGRLTANQRKIMLYIARHGGKSLYSSKVSRLSGVAISSISRVVDTLIEKDYLEKNNDIYRLIVPAYKKLLIE